MTESLDRIDPVVLRGLTQRRLGRRDFLRGVGVGAGALSLSAILAACGGTSAQGGSHASSSASASDLFSGEPAGVLNMANWPLYIDAKKDPTTGQVSHPSLDLFTKETGIEVKYREVIDSPESFFGHLHPLLATGQDTGWDIMVITSGRVFDEMRRLGYFVELPEGRFPNFEKYAGTPWKNEAYDPGNRFSIPYQSGITGIAWDPKQVAQLRPSNPQVTSYQDLLDPAFKGKVGMFGDTLDMPCLTLVGIGVDPPTSTPDDWKRGADVVAKARDDGIVRQFFPGSGYINSLTNGDVAVTMGWSGDIFQQNQSGDPQGLQFTVPKEGGVIWTDNMTIPPQAQHPVDAITYMDFIFRPEVMAMMTESIGYVSPVPVAKAAILQNASEATKPVDAENLQNVANSPLIFPTEAELSRLYNYPSLTPEQDQEWLSIWQPVVQS